MQQRTQQVSACSAPGHPQPAKGVIPAHEDLPGTDNLDGFHHILAREAKGGVVYGVDLLATIFPQERIEAAILEGSYHNFFRFYDSSVSNLSGLEGGVLDLSKERENAWANYLNRRNSIIF